MDYDVIDLTRESDSSGEVKENETSSESEEDFSEDEDEDVLKDLIDDSKVDNVSSGEVKEDGKSSDSEEDFSEDEDVLKDLIDDSKVDDVAADMDFLREKFGKLHKLLGSVVAPPTNSNAQQDLDPLVQAHKAFREIITERDETFERLTREIENKNGFARSEPLHTAEEKLLSSFGKEEEEEEEERFQPPKLEREHSRTDALYTTDPDRLFESDFGGVPYAMRKAIKVKQEGSSILTDPLFNKGSAFPHGERDRLAVRGLLPPRSLTMQQQINRAVLQLEKEDSPIRKFTYLRELHDRNETLFHRVLLDNIKELAPIVYTPTVGQACQEFGLGFRRPRGMYFSTKDRGHMTSLMHNWPAREVQVICVTDGGRILGLGDLGANGMGIPIGKLALYCAAGGIAPHRVLPVMFDAGTNNEELLKDPYYLGEKHYRLEGDEYYEMLDEFIHAVFLRYPHAFLQFEDFGSDKALAILNRYKDRFLCFNDDVQGTGAVAVAGIMSSLRLKSQPITNLKNERIVIAGAGSAGLGVARALCDAMKQQGISESEAASNFYIVDINGVLDAKSSNSEFARSDSAAGMGLKEVIETVKPSILLGLTACPGLFDEGIVRAMASCNDRPIIFPLSNPTSRCEVSYEDALEWTDGRVIFASGSPFDPVRLGNGSVRTPSQCNNMFIFPGLGLGASVAKCRLISPEMIYATSVALAESLTAAEYADGQTFPSIERIRDVSLNVAVAVVKTAAAQNLVTSTRALSIDLTSESEIAKFLSRSMYDPVYVPLID
eukprot:g4472.t1